MSELQYVDYKKILYPDEYSIQENGLNFVNPRRIPAKAGINLKGFSQEEMDTLRESIARDGLLYPLVLVEINGNYILIAGERRKRCIDKLIKDNTSCYNHLTDQMEPARILFKQIQCRVKKCKTLKDIYHLAFIENEASVSPGDCAVVFTVKEWREAGWTDQDILHATGKPTSWLRSIDALASLDEQTLNALAKNEITKSAALELSKIDSVEERIERLNNAREIAAKRHKVVIDKAYQKLQRVQQAVEEIEEFSPENLEEAKEVLAKTQLEVSEVVSRPAKIKTDDISFGSEKELTLTKIRKTWIEDEENGVYALIKRKGHDEDGNSLNIDLYDARLVALLWEGISSGETNIIKILQRHKRNKPH